MPGTGKQSVQNAVKSKGMKKGILISKNCCLSPAIRFLTHSRTGVPGAILAPGGRDISEGFSSVFPLTLPA